MFPTVNSESDVNFQSKCFSRKKNLRKPNATYVLSLLKCIWVESLYRVPKVLGVKLVEVYTLAPFIWSNFLSGRTLTPVAKCRQSPLLSCNLAAKRSSSGNCSSTTSSSSLLLSCNLVGSAKLSFLQFSASAKWPIHPSAPHHLLWLVCFAIFGVFKVFAPFQTMF